MSTLAALMRNDTSKTPVDIEAHGEQVTLRCGHGVVVTTVSREDYAAIWHKVRYIVCVGHQPTYVEWLVA